MSIDLITAIQYILQKETGSKPAEGTIFAIDGQRIDVRISNSSVVLRNVPVAGGTGDLVPGQIVTLRWEGGNPVAFAQTGASAVEVAVNVMADDDSIENSPFGIRVKAAGVRPYHLSFEPSIVGHTHKDSLERNGWMVDADGVVYKDEVYIHPNGQISLGTSPNILKLDAQHGTYRLWSGNVDPAYADFAVTKAGAMISKSGNIAGWDINSDKLSKNGAELRAAGELWLGTNNDIAVLSAINVDNWRLWIGNANPNIASFRVSKAGVAWMTGAHISGDLESTIYIHDQAGWHIDADGWAEFANVTVRGKVTSLVYQKLLVSAVSGREIFTDGALLISDVGIPDTTIVVDNNAFKTNDFVQFVQGARSEWMKLLDDGALYGDGYRYNVTRNLDGGGAQLHYIGETAVRKGTATIPDAADMFGATGLSFGEFDFGGGSYIRMGGFLTMEGDRQWGPYFSVSRRFGGTYSQIVDVVRIGRLDGFLGIQTDEYGIGIGDNSRFLIYDPVAGLRISTASGKTTINDSGVATDRFTLAPGSFPGFSDGLARLYFDLANKDVRVALKNGSEQRDISIITPNVAILTAPPTSVIPGAIFALDVAGNTLYVWDGWNWTGFSGERRSYSVLNENSKYLLLENGERVILS